MSNIINIRGLLVLLGMGLTASPAMAQQPGPGEGYTPPPPAQNMPQSTDNADLDPATKEKFVDAYASVQEIQGKYTTKLQQASDQASAQALQQQAQQEMISAVQDSGLSVSDYNQITQVVANNPRLLAEIQEKAGVN